jgi:hemerythrin
MFEWKDIYAVNIDSIDAQHRRLFQLAGELHIATAAGEGQAVLAGILDSLIQYTALHFAHEEYMMRVHQYPNFAVHKAEHEALTRRVLQFSEEFNQGHTAITFGLLTFLRSWLEKHILQSDHQYAPYVLPKAV